MAETVDSIITLPSVYSYYLYNISLMYLRKEMNLSNKDF